MYTILYILGPIFYCLLFLFFIKKINKYILIALLSIFFIWIINKLFEISIVGTLIDYIVELIMWTALCTLPIYFIKSKNVIIKIASTCLLIVIFLFQILLINSFLSFFLLQESNMTTILNEYSFKIDRTLYRVRVTEKPNWSHNNTTLEIIEPLSLFERSIFKVNYDDFTISDVKMTTNSEHLKLNVIYNTVVLDEIICFKSNNSLNTINTFTPPEY